jgi:hypothetical protein
LSGRACAECEVEQSAGSRGIQICGGNLLQYGSGCEWVLLAQRQFAEIEEQASVGAIDPQSPFERTAGESRLSGGFMNFRKTSQPAAALQIVGLRNLVFKPLEQFRGSAELLVKFGKQAGDFSAGTCVSGVFEGTAADIQCAAGLVLFGEE